MKTKTYILMNVYWFGLAFMWNGLHPIILPALLLGLVPESQKNTYLGGLTFVGLILAMIIQPLAGAWSDRIQPRHGRRRPWMVAGVLCALGILAAMAFSSHLLLGVMATYLLLQVASNFAQGPAQGLIPDLVPQDKRGLASGFKNLFDMGGLVVTSLVAGQLMGANNPALAIAIIGGVLAVSTLITVIGTPEKTTGGAAQAVPSSSLFAFMYLDRRKYPDYARLLFSRFLILLGIYTVQSFAQYFIRDRMAVPNAAEVTGNLMAAIGVTLVLLVFPAGWLSDRIGRKRLNLFAGFAATLGIFFVAFVPNITALYGVGALIGMATGIFLSVNWALATDLIPQEEAGKYMGLTNLATAGAGAASRLAGPLIDAVNRLDLPLLGSYPGYPVAFVLAAALAVLGTLFMLTLKEKRNS